MDCCQLKAAIHGVPQGVHCLKEGTSQSTSPLAEADNRDQAVPGDRTPPLFREAAGDADDSASSNDHASACHNLLRSLLHQWRRIQTFYSKKWVAHLMTMLPPLLLVVAGL